MVPRRRRAHRGRRMLIGRRSVFTCRRSKPCSRRSWFSRRLLPSHVAKTLTVAIGRGWSPSQIIQVAGNACTVARRLCCASPSLRRVAVPDFDVADQWRILASVLMAVAAPASARSPGASGWSPAFGRRSCARRRRAGSGTSPIGAVAAPEASVAEPRVALVAEALAQVASPRLAVARLLNPSPLMTACRHQPERPVAYLPVRPDVARQVAPRRSPISMSPRRSGYLHIRASCCQAACQIARANPNQVALSGP
jgi:hypothetical protein